MRNRVEWRTVPSFPTYQTNSLGDVRTVIGSIPVNFLIAYGVMYYELLKPNGAKWNVTKHAIIKEAFPEPEFRKESGINRG